MNYRKILTYLIAFGVAAIGTTGCGSNNQPAATMDSTAKAPAGANLLPDPASFHDTVDGKPTNLYIMRNGKISVAITNYGARVVSLVVPDKNGNPTDVVLGYDSIGKYIHRPDTYFGAIVGRYGNRIGKGRFSLNGKEYTLAKNDGPNTLHGGRKGFDAVVWTCQAASNDSVRLNYLAKDGEEGYPGNLDVTVTYRLDTGGLRIEYTATTDKPTVLNLTNHSYFNLNGQGSGTINGHILQIDAGRFTPVDATLIPTGKLEPVSGTPLDFRAPTAIGARVNDSANLQIKFGHGYDHNFVLNAGAASGHAPAATVTGDRSGITMRVYTDQPGIQFYGGNFLNGTNPLKAGKSDGYRTAFCLETQHFPDSPNEPSFPTTELKPGDIYRHVTTFAFAAK